MHKAAEELLFPIEFWILFLYQLQVDDINLAWGYKAKTVAFWKERSNYKTANCCHDNWNLTLFTKHHVAARSFT